MKTRMIVRATALILPLGLSVGCTSDKERPVMGSDVNVAPIEQQSASQSGSTQAAPADSTNPSMPAQPNPQLPHDSKGYVGSPYAGNINRATEGSQPKTGADTEKQMKIDSKAATTGATINIDQYGYEQRGDFKDYMEARLDSFEDNIKQLKAAPIDQGDTGRGSKTLGEGQHKNQSQAQLAKQVEQLEKQRSQLSDRVGDIDDVKQADWNTFKTKFRDDVVKLERNYQDLLTAQAK